VGERTVNGRGAIQTSRRFSDEAGQGLPPLFPAPLSPLAALCLRCARDRFHEAEHAQPRRQCGARTDVDGTPFAAWEHRNFAGNATTVATASLIENWIDG
jgi:hypothetical protein